PGVAFKEVGSGPYYLAYANPGVGYTLKANPYYQAPTGCAGQVGCLPLPGQYVQNVIDYWEPTDTVGISEIEAGFADSAGFETPDYGTMLGLIQSGQLGLLNIPTLTTGNFGFNTQIDLSLLATIDSSPPKPINIPANAFAYVGLRATLEYGYPYATAQALGNVIDGIDLGNAFGGFLPPAESAYYNTQTPYPNFDNVTGVWSNPSSASASTVGSPAWYWAQATTASSPFYDPELASFSASNPLYIPIMGFTSAPNINAVEVAWGHSVTTLTGGVVQFQQFFVPSTTEDYTYTTPGQVPWPIWWFGWIPDYPAPVNNWEGAYGTGLWGSADALYQTWGGLYGGNYNASSCGHADPTLANLEYWAYYPQNIIPEVCQGTSWNVTVAFVVNATYNLNTAVAVQLWDLIQDVYNNLQISVGQAAGNWLFPYGPWINPASINENVLIGGGGEWYYEALAGNGLF
ncbi:MAG TPA: hypothetical protein VEG66_00575, partial [Thermoplasmata archaeon]|nr:hypothetical protein [Thermoplasmata archaeon]